MKLQPAVQLPIALLVFLIIGACGTETASQTAGTPIVRVVEALPTTSTTVELTTTTTSQPVETTTTAETSTTLPELDIEDYLEGLDDAVITIPGEGDDVIFRFWTYLAADSFNVSLQASGTVVLVEGSSVYDGAEVYSTWRLSETGKRLLIEEVYSRTGGYLNEPGHALQMNARYYPDIALEPVEAGSLQTLVDRLRNQSWLESEFVSQPEPWIPSILTFLVSGPHEPDASAYEWPLAASVNDLIDPTLVHPQDAYNRQVMCLADAEAAAAWTLIKSGENHAYIPVHDGEYWTLDYDIAFPGYHLFGNPCIETP